MKILFLASEMVPWAKTGGLADVVGALPEALKKQGHDVRAILPYYRTIKKSINKIKALGIMASPFGYGERWSYIYETRSERGVPVYLIEHNVMYDREGLYRDRFGDYGDNMERYVHYCQAALRIMEMISFRPDIIHCHDWQTGLVPALLKGPYRDGHFLSRVPTVFTIHNLGYQGQFGPEKWPLTGLPYAEFFHMGGLEFYGNISLLKSGIIYSDKITTVSPTYAMEIQSPEFGQGMDGIMRSRSADLTGILNGVDYDQWDPAKDKHIVANYSPADKRGKKACKADLIRRYKLDADLEHRPLLGVISRLDYQKGIDLFGPILDQLIRDDLGLVVLGSGDPGLEEFFRFASKAHPGRIGLKTGFDEALAHHIMSGADILIIPSRYEPCGLTQMYALKYGTVPVVRATGGLMDTVVSYDPGTRLGNGFKFGPPDPQAILDAVREAVLYYDQKDTWDRIVEAAMGADFSWDRSASRYMDIYRGLVGTDG